MATPRQKPLAPVDGSQPDGISTKAERQQFWLDVVSDPSVARPTQRRAANLLVRSGGHLPARFREFVIPHHAPEDKAALRTHPKRSSSTTTIRPEKSGLFYARVATTD